MEPDHARSGIALQSPVIRVEVVKGSSWLELSPDEWEALRSRTPNPTPFQSIDWLRCWCRYWPCQPFVLAAYQGKDLVGAMPLVRGGWFGDTVRSMGAGPSDILDPLVEPAVREEVLAAIIDRLCTGPQIIDLHQIRDQIGVPDRFLAMEQAKCLILDLPPTFEEYVATLGKSLRADIKRNRSGSRAGRYRIIRAEKGNAADCIEALFRLHRQRWRRKGLPGAFVGRSLRFQKEWLPIGIANGSVWLSILEIDGTPAGAIYAFRVGQTCFFYQAGMDPVFSGHSPGTTLVAATIERAISEGCTRFDFLRGDEQYKRRWKPQNVAINWRYLRAGRGILRRIHNAEIHWAAGIEGRIRAKLES